MTCVSMNLDISTLNNLTKRSNYSGPINLAQETKGEYIYERTKKLIERNAE